LLLSLIVHGGFLLPLVFLPVKTGRGPGGSSELDTRISAGELEVSLFFCDSLTVSHPRKPQKDTKAAEAYTLPSPSVSPSDIAEGTSPLASPPALPQPATGEEQEGFAGSGASGSSPDGSHDLTGPNTGTTSFFQIATDATTVVYIIDRSASMGLNGLLATAKRELLASLERLPSTARFQVIVYNRIAEPLRIDGRTELALATTAHKQQAARLLQGIHAEGATEHLPALKQALLLRPDVIYFLTDAADMKAEQVRIVTLLNHGGSIIHAIELSAVSTRRDETTLHVLARENRGQYKSVLLSE
jgi:hypothetical protein